MKQILKLKKVFPELLLGKRVSGAFHKFQFTAQLMECGMQSSEIVIVYNYVRMLFNYIWHPAWRSSEILQCSIVSSVAKDCLVVSQYDLHHGSFLLNTPTQ